MALPRLACFLLLAFFAGCSAYYVPGTYPQEFEVGNQLQAQVNSLTSFKTELPYEYYTMPFCKPPEGVQRIANSANLGTVLMGLRIENSVYNFTMLKQELGKSACGPDKGYGPLTKEEVKTFKKRIDEQYRINMILDNLPVTTTDLTDEAQDQDMVMSGFELGYKENDKYYINNHLMFNILVHPTHGEYMRARDAYKNAALLESIDARRLHRRALLSAEQLQQLQAQLGGRVLLAVDAKEEAEKQKQAAADNKAVEGKGDKAAAPAPAEGADSELPTMYMVVGFEVGPCSLKRQAGKPIESLDCADDASKWQEIKEGETIVYSYDVYWQISSTRWASRWDAYLRMPGGKVHWFSILNSILIVLVMATLVAMILIRTVRRDLARYEQLVVEGGPNDTREEAGWKLVTGDVFRAPASSRALCVQIGSGVQVICVSFVTLVLATLGFLSPASRGALLTTTFILYVLLAFVAGVASVALWGVLERSYNGWVGVALHVSLFYPGVNMLIFTVLNIAIHGTGSTGAIPIGMYFTLVAIWFVVSIPLAFTGGYVATRIPIISWPVKTNQIPRQIPPAPVVAHSTLLFFAAGILPFGTMFIELWFAMASMWYGYYYYLFGFVLIISILTIVIGAEISILCTYVQLCAEDYLWWWRSFYRGGSVVFYVTLYAIGFLISSPQTRSGFLPVLVYSSYMSIFILGLWFAMGAIGFLSSLWFVYAIFAAAKFD